MKASYLGLELASPVVVSSSPYTSCKCNIERCVRHGAGAVVLKSIFEEQVLRHAALFDYVPQGMGDQGEYLESYLGDHYKIELLQLIADARATGVPVVASINCISSGDGWIDYAAAMADAGASALELNIFLQPVDPALPSEALEEAYVGVVRRVVEAVPVPVSVKLPMRLTNVLDMARRIRQCGARGVVLFNRFFEPDIDVERMTFVPSDPFSQPSELRNVLRSAALCASLVPHLDVAVSTGVHDGPAAVKALLCGAHVVQVCSAIHYRGYEVIREIDRFVDAWAARHDFQSLAEFRGLMRYNEENSDYYQRVQYLKYFPHEAE